MIEFTGVDFTIQNWQQLLALFMVIAAAALSLVKSFNRLKQVGRLYRNVVWLLMIIATISLIGFIVRPSLSTTEDLVVRLNTSSKELSSIDAADYWLRTQPYDQLNTSSIEISNPEQILLKQPSLKQLEIIGDGLTESQWKGFPNIEIQYQLPDLKVGLINTSWNKRLNLGDTLLVSSELQVAKNSELDNKKFNIILFDPAGDKVAQVEVQPGQRFNLQAQPKLAGNLNYTIEISASASIDSKRPLLKQSIHTSVSNLSNARILMIQSSPSFETKQLQNWAAKSSAKILIKSKISRDKYIHRVINYSALKTYKLSTELFSYFDLVIFDGRGFTELSSQQQEWLTESVATGLGVLILADTSLLTMKSPMLLLKGIHFQTLDENKVTNLSWLDNNHRWTAATEFEVETLAAKMTLNKKLMSRPQKLVVASDGAIIAFQKNYKLGKVAINLFSQSYQWVTLGQSRVHSDYWQSLIANIAKPSEANQIQQVPREQMLFSQQLAKLCLDSKLPSASLSVRFMQENSKQHRLLLQQDKLSQLKQCGYFWPEKPGWYQAKADVSGVPDMWFYVESISDWQAHVQRQKIKATLAKQASYHQLVPKQHYLRPLNQWIFWWLFVVSASLLWLERKFLAS